MSTEDVAIGVFVVALIVTNFTVTGYNSYCYKIILPNNKEQYFED